MSRDLWDVRDAGDGLALELCGGDDPALVLAQGNHAIWVELAYVKGLMAAPVDGAAELAEVLASGGVYHA